jgi:phosphoenolpyruvate synthase/pyruvate phosphate dikinase
MIPENKITTQKKGKYILDFQSIDSSTLLIAGGKGVNLGQLSKIKEIQVPDGFCVTTEAYKKITENNGQLNALLDELTHFKAENRENISEVGAKIRMVIESTPIPDEIAEEVTDYLAGFDEKVAFAVRSSATAEDLPDCFFRRPAGYVSQYYREGGNPKACQQMLGIVIYRQGDNLPY